MSSFVDDTQKWACEYCTYLNFPSAQRCTICRSPKPWHLILAHGQDLNSSSTSFPPPPPPQHLHRRRIGNQEEGENQSAENEFFGDRSMQNSSQTIGGDFGARFDSENHQQVVGEQTKELLDIYQLASRSSSAEPSIGRPGTATDQNQQRNEASWNPDADKWPCPVCTFLNWPRALKCTQCGKRRYEQAIVCSPSQRESNTPTSISIQGSGRNSRAPSGQHSPLPTSEQKALSPSPSLNQPPTSSPPPSGSNTLLDSRIIAKKLQKWTCAACTYENWPKSSRCVMCYVAKGAPITGRPGTPPTGNVGRNSASRSPQPNPDAPTTSSSDGGKEKKRSLSSGKESGRKSPKNSSSSESVNSDHSIGSGAAAASCSSTTGVVAIATASSSSSPAVAASFSPTSASTVDQSNDTILEKTMRRLKKQLRDVDYLWLTALKSIASGGLADCCDPVEAYLAAGGDPARVLTHGEVHILNRSIPGASFEAGHTLFHLAMRYRREDLLTLLLACSDRPTCGNGRPVQRVPCHMSPESAAEIRRQIHMSLRQRKGDTAAYFFTELTTFSLPSSIYDLPPAIQAKLFDALLDRNVQKKLEEEYPIINWSVEVTDRLGSRLFALWNRMCGDCLLDSVLQATWGVFDSENSLRQALAESLSDAAEVFYPRWREYETYLASQMHFTIEEDQFARDWDLILQLASKPGAALEQAHIFVLAHIIRRPIIVYGVRVVKSYFSGESIDYARFEGIYLPLLWEPNFCWRSPICLSYTPGHFTALVPMEPDAYEIGAMAHVREFPQQPRFVYLPLKDSDGRPLPMHFLNAGERGHEQTLLRAWLDVCVTDGGLWCCKMRIQRLSPSVQQMVDDWLDYYRRLSQLHQAASAALSRYGAEGGSTTSGANAAILKPSKSNLRKGGSLVGAGESNEGSSKTENQTEWMVPNWVDEQGENRQRRSPEDEEAQADTSVQCNEENVQKDD